MRGMSSLPLDDDIIDRIFTFLPDFPSLTALRQTSKALNDVYKTRPNSIVRAICYNITGPALHQALTVAQHQLNPDVSSDDILLNESNAISTVSIDERRQLVANASCAKYLEDMFSVMFKDRTSRKSTLNSAESWRFRRALYRLMLYSNIFSIDSIDDIFANAEDDEVSADVICEEIARRKKFLSSLGTSALYEMHSVSVFMAEVGKWLQNGGVGNTIIGSIEDLIIAEGPIVLGDACSQADPNIGEYMGHWYHPFRPDHPICQGYLSTPLQRVLEDRKAKLPAADSAHWLSILDTLPNAAETCSICKATCGIDLYCEESWNILYGKPSTNHRVIHEHLPGLLNRSVTDYHFFRTTFDGLGQDEDDSELPQNKLLKEIHDIKVPPFDAWEKTDLLCESCILEILKSHLHLWILDRKRKDGQTIPTEDCWYGWNCRTQTHRYHHANRLNHLCPPTR